MTNRQLSKVLTGHTTPETAYVVDDYPYGFRLRTSIRFWIETKKAHGQRMVSQTVNPKTGRLNKPKASTYADILVMCLDTDGHVFTDGLNAYASAEQVDEFERIYAEALDGNREREVVRYFRAARRAADKVTWSIHTCTPGCTETHQTVKEQAQLMGKLTTRELWNETLEAINR